MYIHKLGKTTSGLGGRMTMNRGKAVSGTGNMIARHHKRTMGTSMKPEIFEGGKIVRGSEALRQLKVSQSRMPKKYVSFE
jgi:hypothetical protein